jgi:hypothetical protein
MDHSIQIIFLRICIVKSFTFCPLSTSATHLPPAHLLRSLYGRVCTAVACIKHVQNITLKDLVWQKFPLLAALRQRQISAI